MSHKTSHLDIALQKFGSFILQKILWKELAKAVAVLPGDYGLGRSDKAALFLKQGALAQLAGNCTSFSQFSLQGSIPPLLSRKATSVSCDKSQ